MKEGYVKIYRSLQESWLWQDKPFNYASAWIDLIMLANHNGNKFLLGTQLIEVKRGEFITSQEKLARRWGWGNTKLRSFLKLLEKQNMITLKPTQKQTAIEIVNYSVYQTTQIENKLIPNRYQTDTKSIPNTNNNDKNVKNVKEDNTKEIYKEKYLEFVFLTNEEYEKLIAQYSEPVIKEIITRLNNYIGSTGTKYKSHYYTLLNWLRKEKKPLLDNPVSWDKMKSWAEKRRENDK